MEPLRDRDFELIAKRGFGDPWNAYAHAMTEFNGKLYVGTSRGTLAMVKVNNPPPALTPWPIDSPDNVYDLDRRAVIWRYDPVARYWERAYISPIVTGRFGDVVARDIGYRGSCVYQGPDDKAPCLYICTWSSSKGLPPLILRSEDGEEFREIPAPPWGGSINTFRTLVPFKGSIFTTPTGETRGYGQAQECVGKVPSIYESPNPNAGIWREASLPGFGDSNNVSIFEMAVFDGHLYAGTVNPTHGFQIWKTDAEGPAPYRWTRVVTDGALRGPLNEVPVSMVPFKGALYVGTGIINGGYDRHHKVGPAPAEVIRIFPDDRWELLVGDARITPQGVLYPKSSHPAGFGNFFNGYHWRMAVHDGQLYLGSFKWSVLLPYMPIDKWPKAIGDLVRERGIDKILEQNSGFDIWRTDDGISWSPVTRTGFGNRYNWGVRQLVSTTAGLYVGSANPFGPRVAVKADDAWKYMDNRRGGLEVWLAHPDGQS